MQVVVCVKQIPDPASPSSLDPATNRLVRPPEQVLDDTDRYGIEVGLQLGEKTGGSVTLVSMGPTGTMQGIRQALAMGADKAVIVDDDGLGGSDALTTAKVLAAVARREGFDVLVAGVESTDGYSGVVPQMVAEFLGLPCATVVVGLEITGRNVTARREVEGGHEVVEFSLPAVVSTQKGLNEPRYPSLKGIMAAKRKPLEEREVTLDAPTIEFLRLDEPPAPAAGRIVGEGVDAVPELVRALRDEAGVL
jgi:electron transfer flavoprotein beta subunit